MPSIRRATATTVCSRFRRTIYDAVVLDVMLPHLDGWEVLRRLRKQKQTPVLMLTARDAHLDRVRGLDTGGDDYLVKPSICMSEASG
jgi:DNA-binding response OmpR family regulator